jgi:predicted transcriptional regulator
VPKSVTLKLNDRIYQMFCDLANNENRSLSNFIETAVLRFIEQNQLIDEFEMAEIKHNEELKSSLNRAIQDAGEKKGHFVA